MDIYLIIIVFTALSFVIYGFNSFISKRMIDEYKRWGFDKNRKLIGFFQFLGGIGLFIGLKYNLILIISSLSLLTMMVFAVFVRIKIKDNISEALPAFTYILLNGIILYYSLEI